MTILLTFACTNTRIPCTHTQPIYSHTFTSRGVSVCKWVECVCRMCTLARSAHTQIKQGLSKLGLRPKNPSCKSVTEYVGLTIHTPQHKAKRQLIKALSLCPDGPVRGHPPCLQTRLYGDMASAVQSRKVKRPYSATICACITITYIHIYIPIQ